METRSREDRRNIFEIVIDLYKADEISMFLGSTVLKRGSTSVARRGSSKGIPLQPRIMNVKSKIVLLRR